jgi:A/G-specific adenine glycosylase
MVMTESVASKLDGGSKPAELQAESLQRSVLGWFASNSRDFPWRHTSDPFHVLVAEVLLRQTQAWRVREPYLELIRRYPNPETLASADVDELQRWFRPLGLVRRAHHLVRIAQTLITQHGGRVPADLGGLRALPGLGIYSARAILCLSFGMPVPMIDEGSGRVLRRVLGARPQGPAYRDSKLLETAEKILPSGRAKEFNLGLIDIAATYCHARTPSCANCPLASMCLHCCQEVQPDAPKKGRTCGSTSN